MKRLTIALAALGFASCGAMAALPAATDPTLVAIPQLPGGFVIGGTAYYLQPSDSNGDLDYASLNTGTSPNFGSSLKNVEPGYDWGWGVNVGYIFPQTGNDVNLSYFHFSSDDTNSTSVVPGSGSISPISNDFVNAFGAGVLTPTFRFINAKAEYDIDQVDLTAGQFIDVGCRLIMHPFAGLRWTSLERNLTTSYTGTAPTGAASSPVINVGVDLTEKSDFDGIGPLVGVDASYYIGSGFGAVGHFDSALLVGNIDAKTNASILRGIAAGGPTPATPLTQIAAFSYNADDTNRVVPVVDAKLGLDYTLVFNNESDSNLTLEVGWQVSNYFNAVDRLTVTTTTTPATGFIVRRTTSDVGLSGPYASLVFHV